MKITTAPSGNPLNGSAWRDLHQTDAAFSPAYIGEACNQDTANLFAAAPDMLAALHRCIAALAANDAPNCEAAKDARAAIAKATKGQ